MFNNISKLVKFVNITRDFGGIGKHIMTTV
jgi:hypothetical protein